MAIRNKITFFWLSLAFFVFSIAFYSCKNPSNPVTPAIINIQAIQGVTAPATGGTPVTSITETAQYTGIVTWQPNHTSFQAATAYTATITLTAKAGFTLTGVGADYFTVSGASAANPVNSGIVTAVFPSTALTVINIQAIQGVTAPATGGTPVTSITETAQYTGTVTWQPNHTSFQASTAYTATITLSAKAGFTLTGVGADYFTVSGASATNPVNSGIVTAVFPATGTVFMLEWVRGGYLLKQDSITLSKSKKEFVDINVIGVDVPTTDLVWRVDGWVVAAGVDNYRFSTAQWDVIPVPYNLCLWAGFTSAGDAVEITVEE